VAQLAALAERTACANCKLQLQQRADNLRATAPPSDPAPAAATSTPAATAVSLQ
jgi:hypothetical protein